MRRTFAVRSSVRVTQRRSSSRANQTGVGTAVPSLRNVTRSEYLCPRNPEKSAAVPGWPADSNAVL